MSIYIHIPFCKQLCYYCDFYFKVSLARKSEMLEAIANEMRLRKDELQQTPTTLYFGGGTPSLCSIEEIDKLSTLARSLFNVDKFDEFTIECNPDDLNFEYLKGLRNIGVNRLSIGVQSFFDEHLQFMNRRHTAQQAIECVESAHKAGFTNINIDLIYGFQKLSIEQWRKNIELFLSLNIPHLSAYHLGIEPNTIFYKRLQKGTIRIIDEQQSVEQYNLLEELTSKAGFEHYEISNFACNNMYSVHNTAYWQHKPYLGFGPSAHSYDGEKKRRWNIANNTKYIEEVNNNQVFWDGETLSTAEQYDDYIVTSLRTMWGCDIEKIKTFGEKFQTYFIKNSQKFLDSGLLVRNGNKIKIPSVHFLLADGIMRELMWTD